MDVLRRCQLAFNHWTAGNFAKGEAGSWIKLMGPALSSPLKQCPFGSESAASSTEYISTGDFRARRVLPQEMLS